MDEARWEPREPKPGFYSLTWKGRDGNTYSADARGLDVSRSGVGIECSCDLKVGSIVYVQARDGSLHADCEVVHCTRRGTKFQIGLEVREQGQTDFGTERVQSGSEPEPDYYEALQISRKADLQTVHRVFRIMAARFHPDNPETGDLEQFLRMKRAYGVLSDPERRAEYDTTLDKKRETGPRPIFALKDFVTGVEAEGNRRLGVLSLLYNQRQTNPEQPGVSLLDLEQEMGFPREYLSFTMWYLRAKDYVAVGDDSNYALTATGADYLEKKATRNEIAGQLLNKGGSRVHTYAKTVVARRKKVVQPKRQFLLPASPATPNAS